MEPHLSLGNHSPKGRNVKRLVGEGQRMGRTFAGGSATPSWGCNYRLLLQGGLKRSLSKARCREAKVDDDVRANVGQKTSSVSPKTWNTQRGVPPSFINAVHSIPHRVRFSRPVLINIYRNPCIGQTRSMTESTAHAYNSTGTSPGKKLVAFVTFRLNIPKKFLHYYT
ncbi:hypothetical protein TNCV_1399571 [Trichonephila clavipes]|nr:hypothetical protein TNCV_1399571 [Trichonephila clavipes]